jgi:hypothetical protein
VAVEGPQHAFVGEEVDLVADYQPASDVTKIIFEVLTQEGTPITVMRQDFTSSPAKIRWTVEVPKGTKLPTKLKFRATITANGKTKISADFLRVHPPPPLSIWVTHGFTPEPGVTAAMPNGKARIDDLLAQTMVGSRSALTDATLIGTVAPTASHDVCDWDRDVLPWLVNNAAHDKERHRHFKALLEICHARGIKLIAGYEAAHVKKNVTNFMAMMAKATDNGKRFDNPDASVLVAHAKAIHQFLVKNKDGALQWDGIGLDIEIGSMSRRHAKAMKIFVDALADRFGLVTFAGLGYTAPFKGKDGMIVGWPDGTPKPDGKGKTIGGDNEFFNSQPFELCVGRSNVVARPMTYEGAKPDDKYVREMMAFAFEPPPKGLGLARHQMQIGFQIDPQPKAAKNPPGVVTQAEVIQRIRNEMRRAVGGLVMWGLFAPSNKAGMARFVPFDEAYRKKP